MKSNTILNIFNFCIYLFICSSLVLVFLFIPFQHYQDFQKGLLFFTLLFSAFYTLSLFFEKMIFKRTTTFSSGKFIVLLISFAILQWFGVVCVVDDEEIYQTLFSLCVFYPFFIKIFKWSLTPNNSFNNKARSEKNLTIRLKAQSEKNLTIRFFAYTLCLAVLWSIFAGSCMLPLLSDAANRFIAHFLLIIETIYCLVLHYLGTLNKIKHPYFIPVYGIIIVVVNTFLIMSF